MSKDKLYDKFHEELAEQFGSTKEVIALIRQINRGGEGLRPKEMIPYLQKRIDQRTYEIQRILKNNNRDSETIKYLQEVSTDTIDEMLNIQSGIQKEST